MIMVKIMNEVVRLDENKKGNKTVSYTMEDIWNIYNRLGDEESKKVFDARFEFIINGDNERFLDLCINEGDVYCTELDKFEQNRGKQDYILFGCGKEGRKAKKIIEKTGRQVIAWSDNNRKIWNDEIDGIKVLPPGHLLDGYENNVIIITAPKYMANIYMQLVVLGVCRENILIPNSGFIIGFLGKQYFDLFEPAKDEIFMDVGCLDGETTIEFNNWCKGNYNRIYAFEPDEVCWTKCKRTFESNNIENVTFIKKGAWSCDDALSFYGVGRGSSHITDTKDSSIIVPVTSIDSVLRGDKVTFIKMDIEGSEMQALIGAKESIKMYKPKLAICVYHKRDDLWSLANYILKLNPQYNIYLRHYTTCEYETVLYAI